MPEISSVFLFFGHSEKDPMVRLVKINRYYVHKWSLKTNNVATISSHHPLFFPSFYDYYQNRSDLIWSLNTHCIQIQSDPFVVMNPQQSNNKQTTHSVAQIINSEPYAQWTLLQEKKSIIFGIRRRILYYPISLEQTSQLCFSVLEITLYANWKGLEMV